MKRSFISVISLTVVLMLAFGTLLTGCQKAPESQSKAPAVSSSQAPAASSAQSPAPSPIKVKVGYHANYNGASAVKIATEKGYFKAEGLDVELVKFTSGPPEFAAMASGDLDIGFIGTGAVPLCIQGQGKIILVDMLATADQLMARSDKGIKTVADLKGKNVAIPKGTSGEMLFNIAIQKAGIKASDINVVSMDVSGAVAAFTANKVDAVAAWFPYTGEIAKNVSKDKIVVLADNNSYEGYVFPNTWVSNEKFMSKNPEAIKRFIRAMAKSFDFRAANKDESVKLVADFLNLPIDTVKDSPLYVKNLTTADLKKVYSDGTAAKWLENVQGMLASVGMVKEPQPVEKFFDTKSAAEALK